MTLRSPPLSWAKDFSGLISLYDFEPSCVGIYLYYVGA